MTQTGIRMTADELARLPDTGRRRELIEGELHDMAPAGGEHGLVSIEAAYHLRAFIDAHPETGGAVFAAETGFRLARDPDTVRAPDVAYVARERLARARVAGYPELAPDLVVEVVSPNDTAAAVQRKVADWLRAGARLVWVLYPATRTATVFQADGSARMLGTGDDLTGERVLPGFRCRLGDLFG